MNRKADISIVVPLFNEADSLPELQERIHHAMVLHNYHYETIFIDDGSTDHSWKVVQALAEKYPTVKGYKFKKNYGKTQALKAAFQRVEGDIIVTLDADLQDRPEEIPEMCKQLTTQSLDIVSGWKQNRKDHKITKNLPSLLFNWVARKTSGLDLHDFNCGLKAYKLEVVQGMELYADMHRYLPVLAKNEGFDRIAEKRIQHDARKYGKSKFGSDRFIRGFLDLITLWFTSRFLYRPMHLFGAIGSVVFMFGFFFAAYLGINKLIHVYYNIPARLVTENPFFYLSLLCMILGSQLFLAGFIGEILVRKVGDTKNYDITEEVNTTPL